MKRTLCHLLLFGVLLGTGCVTVKEGGEAVKALPSSSAVKKLTVGERVRLKVSEADLCHRRKEYDRAYILYSEAMKLNDDYLLHRQLVLRQCQTLLDMGRHAAALGVLSPLPEEPRTLWDCKRLALASRILSKMKSDPQYVESLLELAIDNSISGSGSVSFKASGYAELGELYVKNGKTTRAIACFERAAVLFDQLRDRGQARACRSMAEFLK